MKKKQFIYIFIFIFSLIIFWIIYFLSDSYIDHSSDLKIESFVSNKTWETDYDKKIYYKKWDELEYIYVIKNDSENSKLLNINNSYFEKELNLDDIKIETEWTYLSWDSATIIKIKWKAKSAGMSDQENLSWLNLNSINIKLPEKNDITKEEQKNTNISDLKIDIINQKYSSNTDNLIELIWTWFDNIDMIWVGDKFFKLNKLQDNKYYFMVPSGSFWNWEYFIFALLKNKSVVSLNKSVKFEYKNQKLVIFNLAPNKIKNDIPRWITLQWKWLKNTISVQLSDNKIFKKTDFNIVSDSLLLVRIPYNLEIWNYFINIMTLDGIYEFPEYKFEITN